MPALHPNIPRLKPTEGCRFYIMMESDSQLAGNSAALEAFETLADWGFQVEVGIAEEAVTRPDWLDVTHDLYILKSITELTLSLAAILHAQGARLINPYLSCALAQDKIVTSRLLGMAGIPQPNSWVTGKLELMGSLAERMPLVIKPYRGHRGNGVRLVKNPEELATVPPPKSPVLIQQFVEGGGQDLKVYVVGEEVFGVLKDSPQLGIMPQSERPSSSGRAYQVSPEVGELARHCGRVLGLGLYGLDILETAQGPVVVDVNAFPSYRGVPNAGTLIAEFIASYARGEIELKPAAPFGPRDSEAQSSLVRMGT